MIFKIYMLIRTKAHVEKNENNIINCQVFNYFKKYMKAIFQIKVNNLRQCFTLNGMKF